MAERDLQLELTEDAKDLLVEKGWDPAMGARPLRRAIQRYIEDPLADFVLRAQVPEGSTVLIDRDDAETADGDENHEVKLSVIEPAPSPRRSALAPAQAPREARTTLTPATRTSRPTSPSPTRARSYSARGWPAGHPGARRAPASRDEGPAGKLDRVEDQHQRADLQHCRGESAFIEPCGGRHP